MLDKVTAFIFSWDKVTAIGPPEPETSSGGNLSVFHWIWDIGVSPSRLHTPTFSPCHYPGPLLLIFKLFLPLSRTHTLCLSPPPALLRPQMLSQHRTHHSWGVSWSAHRDLDRSRVLEASWELLHGHSLVVPTALPSLLASLIPEHLPWRE